MAEVQAQVQAEAQSPIGVPVSNPLPLTSLYVGDLDPNVTDAQLYDVFAQVVEVVSVRVCRDITTRRSLGYAYVNFTNPADAARALDLLNFTPLNNKPIRIMYSNRDPSTRTSAAANIFIKNLDKSINNKALHDTFSAFGNVLSCKIATDPSGQSKGYGYVQFDREEAAQDAIDKLNGMALNDKVVYVGPFLRKQERENAVDNENKEKFSNVFVKNLSESTTEEDLSNVFGEFGQITSTVVMREDDGKSKCFGFVNFLNPDDAARAIQELNGKRIDDREWYVGKALKKSERERELKGRFEQGMKEVADKYQGVNLDLKNLDDSIGDDRLRELFLPFGTIASCKVMRDPSGISKGSGFVAFTSPEEASRALAEMNGKMVGGKPLYVAHAQRKEERKAKLQAGKYCTGEHLNIAQDVQEALSRGAAVVALESTIISHGMPFPQNLQTAKEVEAIVRENGAVPATIAILDGVPCIGLNDDQLERLAKLGTTAQKTSRRDIAHIVAVGGNGATTVSATMFFASKVGIPIFVTGGIGGVHRHGEQTMDISSDLTELGRTPVTVISAGVKSILDIPRTLEFLETHGVTVASYRTSEFPAFFTESSGCKAPCRLDSPEECARLIHANLNLNLQSGMLIAVPIPKEHAASGNLIESAIQRALQEAERKHVTGNASTPFLLARVNELTGGASLAANIALVKNNACVGAKIALALANLRRIADNGHLKSAL